MRSAFIQQVRRRLSDWRPDQSVLQRFAPSHARDHRFGVSPPDARAASVIVLIYRGQAEWKIPLLLRPAHLKHHRGQVALPGGACEGDEDTGQTALRELQEELGVSDEVELLGPLSPFFVPASRYVIHPWVGWTPQQPIFRPNGNEVEQLLETPLQPILDLSSLAVECRELGGRPAEVPYFAVGPYKVWGATCIVLGELATVCRGPGKRSAGGSPAVP